MKILLTVALLALAIYFAAIVIISQYNLVLSPLFKALGQ